MMSWMTAAGSLASWFEMDGDGIYVWPCYLITAVVLIVNAWIARRRHLQLRLEASKLHQNTQVRQPSHSVQGGGQ